MNREYNGVASSSAVFFTGVEVEKTPAHGMQTLFVTGLQPVDSIAAHLNGCRHIFFGANHSFDPQDSRQWQAWEHVIEYFLDRGYLCSLDIPMQHVDEFHDTGLCEYNNFIPQIRVPIPYIRLWNYNTMVKIDDTDFNHSNPGIWTHSLHNLMDRSAFTDWNAYSDDEILEEDQ